MTRSGVTSIRISSKIAKEDDESSAAFCSNCFKQFSDFLRCIFATMLALVFLIIIVVGIGHDYNIANYGNGPAAEGVMLMFFLALLAYNEGFQVGVLRVQHLNVSDIDFNAADDMSYPRAAKVYRLMFPTAADINEDALNNKKRCCFSSSGARNPNDFTSSVRSHSLNSATGDQHEEEYPAIILRSISCDSIDTAGYYDPVSSPGFPSSSSSIISRVTSQSAGTGAGTGNTGRALYTQYENSDVIPKEPPVVAIDNETHPENLIKSLLLGQSFLVVLCSFMIAQLTTFPDFPRVFGIPEFIMNIFVRSGIPGAFLTICCAQLLPSILAKEYPVKFLQLPGVYSVIRLALAIERVGVVEFTFACVAAVKYVWSLKSTYAICSGRQGVHLVMLELLNEDNQPRANIEMKTTTTRRTPSVTINNNNNNINDIERQFMRNSDRESDRVEGDSGIDENGDPSVCSTAATISAFTTDTAAASAATGREADIYSSNFTTASTESQSADSCSTGGKAMTGFKMLMSSCLVLSSLTFVLVCTSLNYSSFAGSVAVQGGVLLVVLTIVFYCEGLKVAVVRTAHLDVDGPEMAGHSAARRLHSLLCKQVHQHTPSHHHHHPTLSPPPPLQYIGGGGGERGGKGSATAPAAAPAAPAMRRKATTTTTNATVADVSTTTTARGSLEENEGDDYDDNDDYGGIDDYNEEGEDVDEDGVARFLIGLQLIVVPLGFLVAQITHFSGFPMQIVSPTAYFCLITVGLPGMLVLLTFAQLTPQLVAESDPIAFLEKRGCYTLTCLALCVEKLGLTYLSWMLYAVCSSVCCNRKRRSSSGRGRSSIRGKNRESSSMDYHAQGENDSEVARNPAHSRYSARNGGEVLTHIVV